MSPAASAPDGPGPDGPGAERVRRAAVELAALAQTGLAFTTDPYDAGRYRRVAEVAADLLSVLTGRPAGDLRAELGRDSGYATPKVDVRAALLDDRERFLLVRERSDGRWSLPGGWADPLDTPAQAAVRELREETGHVAEAVALVGCWDFDRRGHTPALPVAVHKLFFLCRRTGPAGPPEELETLEVGWFGLEGLPELSTGRVDAWELGRVLAHARDPSLPTEFD